MKIMLVTPDFPPNSGSHTQRMIKMANILVERGFELSILTADITKSHPMYSEDLLGDIDERISIFRAPLGMLHRKVYADFQGKSNRYRTNEIKMGRKRILYKIGQRVKKKVLIPDTMVDWALELIKYEKKNRIISSVLPDLIISCSQPSSVHLIGYFFSNKYKIPLFMDYADPWVYLENYNEKTLRFQVEKYIEKKILNYAIGISFSARGCMELYHEKYDIPIEKMVVAMSGYENKLIERSKNKFSTSRDDKISFTYGGALQKGIREPRPFFNVAKDYVNKISVDIRTDIVENANDWMIEKGIAECIRIKGYIPFNQYYDEMLEKDVILFFGNTNNVQIPGKIFNCIATGKHIFYIKSNDSDMDSVEIMLRDYGNSTIVKNDEEDIRRGLDIILSNRYFIRRIPDWKDTKISNYSDVKQYNDLADHIDKVIKENNYYG